MTINKILLIIAAFGVVFADARVWTDNYAWCDPCSVSAIQDNDTIANSNISQNDTLKPVCSKVKNLTVINCNYTNCLFPKGTVIIGGAGVQKVMCTNDVIYKGIPARKICGKACVHVTKAEIITVDAKAIDTLYTYESKVFDLLKPMSAIDAEEK